MKKMTEVFKLCMDNLNDNEYIIRLLKEEKHLNDYKWERVMNMVSRERERKDMEHNVTD